jgi:hypothetical protein
MYVIYSSQPSQPPQRHTEKLQKYTDLKEEILHNLGSALSLYILIQKALNSWRIVREILTEQYI